MACIGGEKLTKDRIHATKTFSANLITEELLPLADYWGTKTVTKPTKWSFEYIILNCVSYNLLFLSFV